MKIIEKQLRHIVKNLRNRLQEKQRLFEMANYNKRDVDLPMNVWIDRTNTESRGGHFKRLKFQLNTDSHVQHRKFASVSLDNNNKIVDRDQLEKSSKGKLSKNELNQVENFVYNNNFALQQLHDELLTEPEFITQVVIKGGSIQSIDVVNQAISLTKDIIRNNITKGHYQGDLLIKAKKVLES